MKLHETIQLQEPLFESFQDLKRVVTNSFIELVGSDSIGNHSVSEFAGNYRVAYMAYKNTMKSYEDSLKAVRDKKDLPTKQEMQTPTGIVKLIRFIAKHPRTSSENPELKDTGHWIKILRNRIRPQYAFADFMEEISDALDEINFFEQDPNRQKPEITTIKKTSKYHIYKPENYMGARKICNMFNTNWCVGSDPTMFTGYGSDAGREMYVVSLPTKKVISFHIGPSSYLITDHSNKNEVSNRGERGEGMRAIVNDIKKAGLSKEDSFEMFREVMKGTSGLSQLIRKIDETFDDLQKKKINKMGGNTKTLIDNEDLVAQVNISNSLYIGKRLSMDSVAYALFFKQGGTRWGVSMSVSENEQPITQYFDVHREVITGRTSLAFIKLDINDKREILDELEDANDESGGDFRSVYEMFELISS